MLHTSLICQILFSSDSKFLACASRGSDGQKVRIWDAESDALQQTFNHLWSSASEVAYSSDGSLAASASTLETDVALWNVANNRHLQTLEVHDGQVQKVCFFNPTAAL